ncbi:hypothetical protein EIP86_008999 [Pleurotus ostreatoroseus]|nr:hypothetical protein EIP86_008999 [Pleurotus ostreatoroseus]
MDFFTATSDADAQPYDGHITTPAHGRPRNSPAAQAEPVDAFAEAINARYSRTNTLLIPLSPNQTPSTAAATPAAPSTFTLTMPPPPLRPLPTLTLPPRPAPPAPSAPPKPPPIQQPKLTLPPRAPPPAAPTAAAPAATTAATAQTSLPASAFTPVNPSKLAPLLSSSDTIILDIRAHNAYTNARLPGALSLSVPSTLLKRPNFSLARLAQMLPSPAARARFSAYASFARVLVYDADSAALTDAGNLLGFMRKLRKEGYAGEVCWLRGGFHAVWREHGGLVDREPPPAEEDEEEIGGVGALGAPAELPAAGLGAATTLGTVRAAPPVLRANHLPMDAFTSTSVASRTLRLPPGRGAAAVPPTPLGMPPRLGMGLGMGLGMPPPATAGALGAGQRTLTMPMPMPGHELAMPAAARHHSVPGTQTTHVPFNPFFDNIRQNIELYPGAAGAGRGGKGADEWIVLQLPRRVRRRVGELPFEWLRAIARGCARAAGSDGESSEGSAASVNMAGSASVSVDGSASEGEAEEGEERRAEVEAEAGDVFGSGPRDSSEKEKAREARQREMKEKEGEELGKALALQFYKIELGEQRRLMGVMEHHSMESATSAASVPATATTTTTTTVAYPVPQLARTTTAPAGAFPVPVLAPLSASPMPVSASASPVPSSATSVSPSVPPSSSASPSVSPPGTNAASTPASDAPQQSALHGQSQGQDQNRNHNHNRSTSKARATSTATSASEHNPRPNPKPKSKSRTKSKSKAGVFPYSITAGVEKGDKNRYRNIWPFEHARVRLLRSHAHTCRATPVSISTSTPAPMPAPVMPLGACEGCGCGSPANAGGDDYMNASYVQPLGTTKRYIATQGPLEATFEDFWTLVWEQNVHVIVMLTREVESALVKCGNYWAAGAYGPLRLTLLATSDTPERERARREREQNAGLFARHPANLGRAKGKEEQEEEQTIRRVFELRHTGFPRAPRRVVTQLQYLEWPDLDVPRDPRGLLRLMREVDETAEAARVRSGGGKVWGEGPLGRAPAPAPEAQATPAHLEDDDSDSAEGASASDAESDAVDSETGVARRALGQPPVLLHCSAGVGRTGGFIAVDAVLDGVRREMRKRREAQAQRAPSEEAEASVPGSAGASASTSAGGSRASPAVRAGAGTASEVDAMEVDSGQSSPPRSLSVAVSSALSGPHALDREGAMDVDRSGSSSPGVMNTDADAEVSAMSSVDNVSSSPDEVDMVAVEMTAPVSVGGRNVHVPVVGFQRARSSSAMDVDGDVADARRSRSISMQPVHIPTTAATHVAKDKTVGTKAPLKPSAELLDEVRRANANASAAIPIPVPAALHAPHAVLASGTSTDRSASLGASFSGFESPRSGSSASPASSSRAGSSGSAALPSRLGRLAVKEKELERGVQKGQAKASAKASAKEREAGLDRWREGVDAVSAGITPATKAAEAQTASQPVAEVHERDPTREDHNYATAAPRKLHGDASPPLLSTYAEPIRSVIEDMREQRMSLCQSLRQYVFVHRAIIEGALMIVDAEREREAMAGQAMAGQAAERMQKTPVKPQGDVASTMSKAAISAPIPVPAHPDVAFALGAIPAQTHGLSAAPPLAAAFVLKEIDPFIPRKDVPMGIALPDATLSAIALSSPSPRSKRQASPTELVQESPSGDRRLSKRPSVKRKQRSSDEESTDSKEEVALLSSPLAKERNSVLGTRYEAMALSTPSPVSSPPPTKTHHQHHHHHHRQQQTAVEGSTGAHAGTGAVHMGAAATGLSGSR